MDNEGHKNLLYKKKKELFLLYRHTNDQNIKERYKKYSKILAKVIILAKRMHYKEIICKSKNKVKNTWKIVNEAKGKYNDRPNIQFLNFENNTIANQEKISNIFNDYFLSVAISLKKGNKEYENKIESIHYLHNCLNKPHKKMKWKYISTYEIEKIINSLNSKNSNGYDDISNRVIKISAPFIISPLTYICNAIFKNGTFPERLKYAMVIPKLKKGNQHEVSNYRLIYLLTAFSKK